MCRYAPDAPEQFKVFLERKQKENKQLLDFYLNTPEVRASTVPTML
jgi:hypothetical protein